MKILFIFLISCFSGYSQNENFINYYNFCSEAEYHFHEENYDSTIYYYELGLSYVKNPNPNQHYKYAKALWKLGKNKKALDEFLKSNIRKVDTTWFSGLSNSEYDILNKRKDNYYDSLKAKFNVEFYSNFIDSIANIDRFQRNQYTLFMDSLTYIEPYPKRFMDSIGPIMWEIVEFYDRSNAEAVIKFAKKHGFPGGQNIAWNPTPSAFILHMEPEWFVKNYPLLYREVLNGNLEPWMLASGIDRMFTVEIGEDKINPYNRYWTKSVIDPFLMFYNCIKLGVSPYYDYNWSAKPRKTIHFEYYQKNKKYYNTCIMN